MTYIYLALIIWLYLYLWHYTVSRYMYNKRNLIQTIILITLFSPILLVIILIIGIVNIITLLLGFPVFVFNKIFKKRKNLFWEFRTEFNKIFVMYYYEYKLTLKVTDLLNKKLEGQLIAIKYNDILVDYFVALIKCGLSNDFIATKIEDFKVQYFEKSVEVLEWIKNDETFDDDEMEE